MQYSRVFKSSTQCQASPDGLSLATISASNIRLISTKTLRTTTLIKLPSELGAPKAAFLWSPSCSKILVAVADQIQVFSVQDASHYATIRNPTSAPSGKPAAICFGARDTEILVHAPFGHKLLIYDLTTGKALEIPDPKFYLAASAWRGYSIRGETEHMAVLTRTSGKDLVSIHHPVTRQIQRSWHPECVDAQGLTWTPDGRWLLLWDSPSQGHRLLLYTPDGQLFRSIGASALLASADADLESGIRALEISPSGHLCALGDFSRRVIILQTSTWADVMKLSHPTTIVPKDTLQVWQEQLDSSVQGLNSCSFIRCEHMVSPQIRSSEHGSAVDAKSGCSLAVFDASSNLLATRLDEFPSTLWIWDLAAHELRAVLLFHLGVTAQWHPTIRELLLVSCQEGSQPKTSFVWDPLSDGPTPAHTVKQCADSGGTGRVHARWISRPSDTPLMLLGEGENYKLLSMSDPDSFSESWVVQDDNDGTGAFLDSSVTQNLTDGLDDTSVLEDTFSFKRA